MIRGGNVVETGGITAGAAMPTAVGDGDKDGSDVGAARVSAMAITTQTAAGSTEARMKNVRPRA
jgi:hypothetical protein